jgi:hypothetical protein
MFPDILNDAGARGPNIRTDDRTAREIQEGLSRGERLRSKPVKANAMTRPR